MNTFQGILIFGCIVVGIAAWYMLLLEVSDYFANGADIFSKAIAFLLIDLLALLIFGGIAHEVGLKIPTGDFLFIMVIVEALLLIRDDTDTQPQAQSSLE